MADGGNTALTPTHNQTFGVFTLKAVQTAAWVCHTECRTALCHQISGERLSETGEILCRLSAHYGEDTSSHASMHDWCFRFYEGHEQVTDQSHGHVRPTSVTDVDIHDVEAVILENK